MHQDSPVTTPSYELDDQGSIPGKVMILLFPSYLGIFWDPFSLLSNQYFLRRYSGWKITLNTQLYLVPRLIAHTAILTSYTTSQRCAQAIKCFPVPPYKTVIVHTYSLRTMLFNLLDYFTSENGGTVMYRWKRPLTKYNSFSCSTFRIKRRGSGDQVTALMLGGNRQQEKPINYCTWLNICRQPSDKSSFLSNITQTEKGWS